MALKSIFAFMYIVIYCVFIGLLDNRQNASRIKNGSQEHLR